MNQRFQFSVRALLLVTALVAAVSWLTYLAPSSIGIPALSVLTMVLASSLIIVLVYGDVSGRPFCIGALVPLVTSLLQGHADEGPFNLKTFGASMASSEPAMAEFFDGIQGELGMFILSGVVTGLLAVGLHWWLTSGHAREG